MIDRVKPEMNRLLGDRWVTVAALVGAALGTLLLVAPQAFGSTPRPCNGSSDLCSKTLRETVIAGTHNSMAASDLGWTNPNQTWDIPRQLRSGARVLLVDTYYGRPLGNGQVQNVPESQGAAEGAAMYLCHSICVWGASPLTPELSKIAAFLKRNPREVLVLINQDSITPDDFARAVSESGLGRYLYRDAIDRLPTLARMIDRNQRVVMLAESDSGNVPWYHLAYDGALIETPYSFATTAALTSPADLDLSCRANRGKAPAAMFLMNHWVYDSTTAIPLIADAGVVNTKEAIVTRARACQTERGRIPNLIAVDFIGTGDAVGAIWELNGTTPGWRVGNGEIKRLARRACRKKKGRVKSRCVTSRKGALLKERLRWSRWGT